MLLTINAPHIEARLQRAAQQQNTSPAELAQRLLDVALPAQTSEPQSTQAGLGDTAPGAPEAVTSAQRKARFHTWLEFNRTLQVPALPDDAFERASFYEDERHLKPEVTGR